MNKYIFCSSVLVLVLVIVIGIFRAGTINARQTVSKNDTQLIVDGDVVVQKFIQLHVATPQQVRALYLTAWAGGTNSIKTHVADLIDASPSLNAVVIDIKDATGKIAYRSNVPLAVDIQSSSNRIPDIQSLVEYFHSKGIYVIGRVSVFQDPVLARQRPEWALQTTDGEVWLDRGGLAWLDPAQKSVWDYNVAIGAEAYEKGFDEINLDYVRYPSDGDMAILGNHRPTASVRISTIGTFFAYMDKQFRNMLGVPLSADVFGLTTSAPEGNDLGIGQDFLTIAQHVDAIAPMIYPSHYTSGFAGQSVPAQAPFTVIDKATADAIKKLNTAQLPIRIYRPWIQDFDLGTPYGVPEVQAQISALQKNTIDSYMVWDPANRYTVDAYSPDVSGTAKN